MSSRSACISGKKYLKGAPNQSHCFISILSVFFVNDTEVELVAWSSPLIPPYAMLLSRPWSKEQISASRQRHADHFPKWHTFKRPSYNLKKDPLKTTTVRLSAQQYAQSEQRPSSCPKALQQQDCQEAMEGPATLGYVTYCGLRLRGLVKAESTSTPSTFEAKPKKSPSRLISGNKHWLTQHKGRAPSTSGDCLMCGPRSRVRGGSGGVQVWGHGGGCLGWGFNHYDHDNNNDNDTYMTPWGSPSRRVPKQRHFSASRPRCHVQMKHLLTRHPLERVKWCFGRAKHLFWKVVEGLGDGLGWGTAPMAMMTTKTTAVWLTECCASLK